MVTLEVHYSTIRAFIEALMAANAGEERAILDAVKRVLHDIEPAYGIPANEDEPEPPINDPG